MKVIGFNGSPRKGFNTENLVKTVLDGVEKKEDVVKKVLEIGANLTIED